MADNRKIAGEKDIIAGWSENEINNLELSFLHKQFVCSDPFGVDVTVTFARYMSKVELNSDNYPIFLKLLQFENHWVVDALLSEKDPLLFFIRVQPNTFIISECFKMFTRWKPGGIYPKSLLVLIGLLKTAYENPHEGYKIYNCTISDINNLGKHLDKTKDQKDDVNKALLYLLDKLALLGDLGSIPPASKTEADVAVQANNIRGKFLDITKQLNEAIPDELLKRADFKKDEIAPSLSYTDSPKKASSEEKKTR